VSTRPCKNPRRSSVIFTATPINAAVAARSHSPGIAWPVTVHVNLAANVLTELRVRGITTVEAANAWVVEEGIRRYNTRFRVPAAQEGTAFVPCGVPLDHIFSVQHERMVGNDNTVQIGRRRLQLGASRLRCHFVRCRVVVHEHLDGTLSVTYGPHVIGRYAADGRPLVGAAAA
jgi:hypothetical protein